MGKSAIHERNEKGGFQMKWFKKKKSAQTPQANLYDSIETLPIWNWNKISETNEYKWLKKTDEYVTPGILKKTWEKIFAEFIDRFGFNDDFLATHRKKSEIAFLQHQFIIFSDRSICTFVEIAQKELAGMSIENPKGDFWKSVAMLKKSGFSFDAKSVSVVEFHSYFELLKEERKTA